MVYSIRPAAESDLPRILEIYEYARDFMARTGNPNQWGKTNPAPAVLERDIAQGRLNVLEEEGRIHGVFYYFLGDDPTYAVIEGGGWSREAPYGTIHRIAGDGSGGVLRTAVGYALDRCPYLRIDTHRDNHVMQGALAKLGFHRCGTIYLASGSPRIAFDLYQE